MPKGFIVGRSHYNTAMHFHFHFTSAIADVVSISQSIINLRKYSATDLLHKCGKYCPSYH